MKEGQARLAGGKRQSLTSDLNDWNCSIFRRSASAEPGYSCSGNKVTGFLKRLLETLGPSSKASEHSTEN